MLDTLVQFSTTAYDSAASGTTTTTSVIGIAISVLTIIGFWGTFIKAGRHGWAAIIPFYNVYTLLKVAGRPGWWLILYIIPIVNIVIHIIVSLDVARAFGRSGVFGVFGLWLFPFVGYLITGYGRDAYQGVPAH